MGDMKKRDITRLAFEYGYFPSYSGKLRRFFFRVCDYSTKQPTEEQAKHMGLFGTIVL